MSNIRKQIVSEIQRPARKNYSRRKVIITGLNDLILADLVEMIPYAKFNKGFRYISVVINVLGKYVWVQPVKRKTAKDVTFAIKLILNKMRKRNLQTHSGKEFYSN